MAPFVYPKTAEEGNIALSHFLDYATQLSYKNVFQAALDLAYGPGYQITVDLSNRMNFFCMVCSKTMNAMMSLESHNRSGAHLKNMDRSRICAGKSRSSGYNLANVLYKTDSLQFQILSTRIPVLGAHLLEGYSYGSRNPYYKCILCGAHGTTQVIYQHVIGDKHTDRYIKFNVDIKHTLNLEQKDLVRKNLSEKDGIQVDRIIIIKNRHLFPQRWEDDGLSKDTLVRKYRSLKYSSNTFSKQGPLSSGRRVVFTSKPDVKRTSSSKSITTVGDPEHEKLASQAFSLIQNIKIECEGGSPKRKIIIERDPGKSMSDQEVHVYTNFAIKRCLLKLNFIVKTQEMTGAELLTGVDVEECISLMLRIVSLLQSTFNSRLRHAKEKKNLPSILNIEKMLKILSKLQKCVAHMMDRWTSQNSSRLK